MLQLKQRIVDNDDSGYTYQNEKVILEMLAWQFSVYSSSS